MENVGRLTKSGKPWLENRTTRAREYEWCAYKWCGCSMSAHSFSVSMRGGSLSYVNIVNLNLMVCLVSCIVMYMMCILDILLDRALPQVYYLVKANRLFSCDHCNTDCSLSHRIEDDVPVRRGASRSCPSHPRCWGQPLCYSSRRA